MDSSGKFSTTPLIRLSHPRAFTEFLEEVGAPTERLLRQHGLPVYCDDLTVFVPLRQAWSLFDAAAQLEDPMVGWHVGRYHGDKRLGQDLLKQIESAPTLYQALRELVRKVSSEASHLQLGILERPHEIVFHTQYAQLKDWPGYSQSQAYQLGVYLALIRHYLGRQWVPDEIGIEYPTASEVVRRHFPGSRIRTGQRVGYITVPRSSLCVSVPASQTEFDGDSSVELAAEFDYPDTLKALLKAYVSDGYPSAQKIARLLDTSPRTLFRKLSERGLRYQGLVDEVRFEMARELLQDRDARIDEVSMSVGFDDPSHFARMFRRVGGLSPREFRELVRT